MPESERQEWIDRLLRQHLFHKCDKRDEFAIYALAQERYEDWLVDQELACGVGGTWVPIKESE